MDIKATTLWSLCWSFWKYHNETHSTLPTYCIFRQKERNKYPITIDMKWLRFHWKFGLMSTVPRLQVLFRVAADWITLQTVQFYLSFHQMKFPAEWNKKKTIWINMVSPMVNNSCFFLILSCPNLSLSLSLSCDYSCNEWIFEKPQ